MNMEFRNPVRSWQELARRISQEQDPKRALELTEEPVRILEDECTRRGEGA
jgi:hypothetical protein